MVTCEIILETRVKSSSGLFPVKLRVTHQRVQRYYSIDIYLSIENYELVMSSDPPRVFLKLKKEIKRKEAHGLAIIQCLNPFSFEEFKKLFKKAKEGTGYPVQETLMEMAHPSPPRQEENVRGDIQAASVESIHQTTYPTISIADPHPEYRGEVSIIYDHLIWKSIQRMSAGNAESQNNSRQSFLKFRNNLQFSDITSGFLFDYEDWMLKQGLSLTTVGMYARSLRAVYNEAIVWGLASKETYPFTKRQYLVPAGNGSTDVLLKSEVALLFNYQPANVYEQRSKDFWFFSYLSNGINARDICELKFKNIKKNEYIQIDRRVKVRRTTRSKIAPIIINLTDFHREVITRQGNRDKRPENYIFPVFRDGMSPKEEREAVKNFVKKINKYLKQITGGYALSAKTTTGVARPSFCTHARDAGATTEEVKEYLGHADIRTTQYYIHSLQTRVQKQLVEKLLPMKVTR